MFYLKGSKLSQSGCSDVGSYCVEDDDDYTTWLLIFNHLIPVVTTSGHSILLFTNFAMKKSKLNAHTNLGTTL
jgi:hypothetical protein